eukprot:CAMPEP_0184349548 /NCGR_PEP_ID=MMETSP1089-20130417/34376_1 /TAXON_ID=38269 ORGANISM="Gloeochaete wittrockiana, Strain SAG46.84" /NCGR_SAMPLE_ID=MMETSP1089 /ASSEMBLY_ACC=CAM_ASM_000445 /LENGTH=515 /DNA_ID=CAMNT_0026681813 /DNA_START=54 /DNA_END=1598 /DNA_ORIENTATION=+
MSERENLRHTAFLFPGCTASDFGRDFVISTSNGGAIRPVIHISPPSCSIRSRRSSRLSRHVSNRLLSFRNSGIAGHTFQPQISSKEFSVSFREDAGIHYESLVPRCSAKPQNSEDCKCASSNGLIAQHQQEADEKRWIVRTSLPVEFFVEETPGLFDIQNRTLIERFVDPSRPLRRFFAVDENVWAMYGKKMKTYLAHHGVEHHIMVVPVEEKDKTMDAALKIIEELSNFGLLRRHEPIIAVGGGVLLDIVGFAASLYRRGVPYIRVPTTLLAQVDASVGAKTGLNHVTSSGAELKNRIGTYWPPLAAFIDRTFLPTVDDRNMRNGVCEMLKMAMVRSEKLFSLLEDFGPVLIGNKFQGTHGDEAVQLSIQLMLEELQPNLWEVELERLVDFGHSFSKVIEMRALPELLHGEAVNLDGAFSTILAHQRGLISDQDRDRIFRVMHSLRLPIDHPLMAPEVLWEGLVDTLEHRDGKMRLPLPTGIGKADFVNDVTFEEIENAATELHRYTEALKKEW